MRCAAGRHRLTWNSAKGWYCWPCEQAVLRAACEHTFDDPHLAGILGWRWYCGKCGELYVGPVDESGKPSSEPATAA